MAFIRRKPRSHQQLEEVDDRSFVDYEFSEWNNVMQQIKKLPEVDKTLIFLFLEDKSYREIAEIMGISESNVGVKLIRIKRRLKDYFTD